MLLTFRKKGLTSLFKEVRVFEEVPCYLYQLPLSPQALPTGKLSRLIICCNLLPDNYRDEFQANEFGIHYRFLTGTWKRQNHRLPAEILWELNLVIFDWFNR